MDVRLERGTTMFGIFKKKATPAPAVELSDDALDLIHGGCTAGDLEAVLASDTRVHEFDARDAVVAVVGRGDARGGWSRG
jgi:hypothetical protein